ncbi:ATP-binding protein [Alloacidobacterium dinghuense]|uniref:ATP-binding protein n=1 Tax=Alloacidobacterium dinghuense TaxID=2763107 RepID=A0A7G8BKU2_9BACT|nr:ATP-binding protein [Alloacidobacterium dinghuense]QNI33162.1 ATP-binding protein [Alloacidobacterium dinghuense]
MPIEQLQDFLVLDSRLTEVSRAQSWAEAFADRFGVTENIRYAIRLCLEEALANVIRHGYRSESGHRIVIRCWCSSDTLFFAIDDKALLFNPADALPRDDGSEPVSLESIAPGGNGLPLLRHFAGSLAYERLPEGNRLTMGFSISVS